MAVGDELEGAAVFEGRARSWRWRDSWEAAPVEEADDESGRVR